MSLEFVTNEEIVRAARAKLAQGPWDYLVGGSESETTMRRNRLAPIVAGVNVVINYYDHGLRRSGRHGDIVNIQIWEQGFRLVSEDPPVQVDQEKGRAISNWPR